MRSAYLLSTVCAMVLAPGCDKPPKQGDVYEEKLTSERFRIGCVGLAQDCYRSYQSRIEYAQERGDLRALIQIGIPVMLADPSAQAVTVEKEKDGIVYHHITTRGDFDREFLPVR